MSKQPILFDVDGVITNGFNHRHDLRGENQWSKNLTTDFGIDQDRFAEEFIRGPFTNEVLKGETELIDSLREHMPSLGYHGDPQRLLDYWMENDTNTNQDLLKQIERLSGHPDTVLFLATNQEHNRANHLMNSLELCKYFKDIFYAARFGVQKPKKDFFVESDKLLTEYNNTPIFFDDSPACVEAAKIHGWDAYVFETTDDLYKSGYIFDILQNSEKAAQNNFASA